MKLKKLNITKKYLPLFKRTIHMINIITSTDTIREYLGDKIEQFNASQVPFTQKESFINIAYHIEGDNSKIIAGIDAILYCWGCLFINMLWVDEKHRKQGLGSILLAKAESSAKEIGCTLAHLDTFDFQAKDFYLKHGYEIFGELKDCPPGHARFYMKKIL